MIEKWFHAMNFIRVLIDFILIAQYKSHDDSTLNYLDHVLFRFNAYKKIFRHSRFKEHEIEKNHFNFSNFHAITHYVDFINDTKSRTNTTFFMTRLDINIWSRNSIFVSINEKSFRRNWSSTTKDVSTFSRWKIWSDI
jgi:hypothetical protein